MRFFGLLFPVLLFTFVVSGAERDLQLGVGVQAERTAYKGYRLQWSVAPVVNYENDYVYFQDFSLGGKLINIKNGNNESIFTTSVFAFYDDFKFARDKTSDWQLKQLNNRHESVYAGGKLTALTPFGLFEAEAARDILGHGDGLYGSVTYHIKFDLGPAEIFPHLGVEWADSRYNKYFYGISQKESRRSGLSTYRPSASIAPFVGVAVRLPLAKRWELLGNIDVSRVPKTVKNSPMTDKRVTCVFSAMLGFNF